MRKHALHLLFVALAAFAPREADAQKVVIRGGVDSLRVTANIQTQFNTTSADDEPSSEWLVRRGRLGVGAWAAGWIYGFVEGDFGRGRVELTDGYARLDFALAARVQLGHYKKPFDVLELTSSRELLVVERDGSPRGATGFTPSGLIGDLRYSDRDVGGTWSGVFGPSRLTAGVFNGAGRNRIEDDDGKQLVARLEVSAPAGWRLAGAWSGLRISEPLPDEDAEPAWFHAFEAAATFGEYLEPGWKGLLQGFIADNYDPDLQGGEDVSLHALQGIVAYHFGIFDVPYLIGVEPVARVGWTDPDTDAENDFESTLWTGGLNLYHHRSLKTQVGIDHLDPRADGESTTAFRIHSVLAF